MVSYVHHNVPALHYMRRRHGGNDCVVSRGRRVVILREMGEYQPFHARLNELQVQYSPLWKDSKLFQEFGI